MTSFLIAFTSLVALLGGFTWLLVPSVSAWRRTAASLGLAVVASALFFGYSDMLGKPKATRLDIMRSLAGEANVLGSYVVEGTGIFLWLRLDGVVEPRYYVLPWSTETAKRLQKAQQENEEKGGVGVRMKIPYENSLDPREPLFYEAPQPKIPDKNGEPMPEIYRAPEQGA